ncbi:MAG: hypothetical protein ACR2NV_02950 [Thermoleophilaceae bacterium]
MPTRKITDRQRRYIASLARQCGVGPRFFGNTGAASFEINRLKALLAAKGAREPDVTEPRSVARTSRVQTPALFREPERRRTP